MIRILLLFLFLAWWQHFNDESASDEGKFLLIDALINARIGTYLFNIL